MNSVELIGYYGGDETHALSAWTSTARELTDERRERIGPMLKQLADAGHHTPFEKSMLHFLVRCDTASHIHIIKHRIGVSVNGESARYKELGEPTFNVPGDWPKAWQNTLQQHADACAVTYHMAVKQLEPILGRKRAKESARYFLPYANQLTLDVSFNFRSFMHFVGLRADEHAQLEIRSIAEVMLAQVAITRAFDLSLVAFGR